jgi:hypothetical protein
MRMKTTLDTGQRFVFLGSQKGLFKGTLPPSVFVCRDRSEIEAAFARLATRVTSASLTSHSTETILSEAVDGRADLRGSRLGAQGNHLLNFSFVTE